MYKARYFVIQELVPKHVYEDRGSKAWSLLDSRAVETLDALRERFGSITVNDWSWGGDRQWSGLRTELSPYGTMYSQHRFGRAFDCLFRHSTSDDVREYISTHLKEFPHITALEMGVSWLHFDVRGSRRSSEGILRFYP